MSSPGNMEHELDVTYRYFSHHIRTCTSVVVAMLDMVVEGLNDDSMNSMILESGYLLDIYDRGMSVCFNHILNKPHRIELEKVDISLLLNLYVKNAVSAESPAALSHNIGAMTVECDAYSFKSLFQIMLQEGMSSASKELKVTRDKNSVVIEPDTGFNEVQPVFSIFAQILERSFIMMDFSKSSIRLRFSDESIDS